MNHQANSITAKTKGQAMAEIDQVKRQMMYDDDFIDALGDYIKGLDEETKFLELYDFWWRWIEENMTREDVTKFIKTGEL